MPGPLGRPTSTLKVIPLSTQRLVTRSAGLGSRHAAPYDGRRDYGSARVALDPAISRDEAPGRRQRPRYRVSRSASTLRSSSGRSREVRRRRHRRLLRTILTAGLLLVLVPAAYSYVTTMVQPSSLPLSIRTIEWIKDHQGDGLVNAAERLYYTTIGAPAKGGSGLASLPVFGLSTTGTVAPGKSVYVPPAIAPVLTPALVGEGTWRAATPASQGAPPILVSVFRPEPDYPRQLAYVAWIDTSRTQLALYPGRDEPPNAAPRGPMQVPRSQRSRLLATFNSGFKYKDSNGGFAVNGKTLEPMVAGQGTVIAYADGHVDVTAWQGGASVGPDVLVAKQNLPLIVIGGRPNPSLNSTKEWGKTLGNAVRVWRSALGVDSRGNLIYLAALGQTAPSLADAIIHAGAIRAIQLDINATWPSFITYAAPGGRGAAKLVPNPAQSVNRYLVPDDRDFFTVYGRVAGVSLAVPSQ